MCIYFQCKQCLIEHIVNHDATVASQLDSLLPVIYFSPGTILYHRQRLYIMCI